MFVAVLDSLASCYRDQQMFIEAEDLYQKELKLWKESPHENRQPIATGQACKCHYELYSFTLLLLFQCYTTWL